ncbi:MAG: hypothetical protein JOZ99_14660 [Actinobacteria bacterium]|nr:hypothetical protein [Actinomycetota bacterium]
MARVAAAGAAAVALVATSARGTGAATTKAAPPVAAGITLLEQPASVPVHGDVTMKVRIDGDPNRLSVQAAMHNSLSTRTGFNDSLQGSTAHAARYFPLTRVSQMTGSAGVYDMGLSAPGSTGVYPLDVTLYDASSGTRVDGFRTYVVATPGPGSGVGTLLQLAWIWPFVANPAYMPNGAPDSAVVGQLAPNGSLGRIASLLAHTGLPITLAPSPETVESLVSLAEDNAQLAATLDALRQGTKAALRSPYVPIDVPSLVSAGIRTEIGSQLDAGTSALAAAGIPADRAVMVNPIDRGALNQLAALGVDRLVVDPSQLQPMPQRLTPSRPFQLQADPRNVNALVIDSGLSSLLTQADLAPPLRAQRFIAGLAVVQSELPGNTRGVVVAMPSDWNDDPAAVDAASIAAQGLQSSPLVKVVGVGSLFDTVQADTRTASSRAPLVRQVIDSAHSPSPIVSAHDLREKRTGLDAFRAVLGADDPRVRRGEQALLVSMSSVWTGTQGRRRVSQELRVIDASISQYVDLIRGPQQTTVTITARRAEIPISFQNASSEPITVRLRLDSEKLFFPNGSDHVITLPPHNTTTRFAVETRASGTFPLHIIVSSPDGGIVFERTNFTVRSTVVSGMGLFLTLGAGLFLAGWWANHYRRRRRAQRMARSSGSVPAVTAPDALQPTTPATPAAPTGGAIR